MRSAKATAAGTNTRRERSVLVPMGMPEKGLTPFVQEATAPALTKVAEVTIRTNTKRKA